MADNGKLNDEEMLDAFLDSARHQPLRPDAAFLARLTDDMMANLPVKEAIQRKPAVRSDLFHRFQAIFAASGLTGAAALGIWIGLAMPETLNMLATGYDSADAYGIGVFLPAADLAALEE